MRFKIAPVIIVLLLLFIFAIAAQSTRQVFVDGKTITFATPKEAKDDAMRINFRVLNQLRQTPDLQDKNLMFSPFSLQMAFMMLANGAEGETRQEILKTFGVNDLQKYDDTAQAALQALNVNQDMTFNIANSIWINRDYYPGANVDFTTQFKSDMQNYFSANAAGVNNATGAKTINDWISGKTNNKINSVLTDQDMPSILLCLVNTIYFKADWQAQFKNGTTKAPFTEQNGQVKQTDFMHQTDYFNYYEDTTMQMLEMSYQGADISLYVLLPKEVSAGLAGIDSSMVEKAIANKSQLYVDVIMPKFKTETAMNLKGTMQALGITRAFSKSCPDLTNKLVTGLPNGDRVYITRVIQKSFIQVDGKGTEAAAATVITAAATGRPAQPLQPQAFFNANRPFMYLIRNNTSGDIYFMGQYSFVQ